MTKQPKIDPHAAREARKYELPIKSREFILEHLEARASLLSLEQIARELDITDETGIEALRKRLNAMERDGQLVRNRRGRYGVASKMNVVRGRVIGHPDGYGFLVPDDGSDDLFLSAKQLRSVIHGDRVIAKVIGADRRGRREGALVEVLERNTHQVVGRYFSEGGLGFVVASNKRISQDIVIPPDQRGGANEGQIVVAAITEQPSLHSQPVGRVVEVLGDRMAPGMEIEIAIRTHELPDRWPEAAEREAEAFPESVPASAVYGREDLRLCPLVTIDGEDAKDFDDAVYCERSGRGWRLIVAIADVSHYVQPGSALDKEALNRGNSVYFPQRVLPMLPEALSNNLCSLRPRVDRLCLACELTITQAGRISGYRFFDAVMCSHARLTYDEVAAMLVEGNPRLIETHKDLMPHLENLYQVYKALLKEREKRGAIDFDSKETRIVFGERRKISKIVPLVRNDAHRMIEECMIAANVAAASYLLEQEIAIVFRTHPQPDQQKLEDVRGFLSGLGLRLAGGEQPRARDYARLMAEVAERPDRRLIETVLLRSLPQAMYTAENIGHFGLALEAYTHFTSPIRRYPDLLVHRAIRHGLSGQPAGDFSYSASDMQTLGDHCSMTERRADEATRDAVDWLKCEFVMSEIGKEFDGIITGVTSFGLFVELDDIYVQGLVHVTTLGDDYYQFDPVRHMLYGERGGATFRLADKIRVKVVRVDLDERSIDFVLAEPSPARKSAARSGGKARAGGGAGARAKKSRRRSR
ncbi:MAG: ribonuclease R [Gammaproteobacteria bacterium]|nr:ribonuclease R [Gammaproteobacteria bacterium]